MYSRDHFSSKDHDTPTMAKVISGTAISKQIRSELREQIAEWTAQGNRAPHLTAVLIGDDPASHTYVNNKIKVTHLFHPTTVFINFVLFSTFQHFIFIFVPL